MKKRRKRLQAAVLGTAVMMASVSPLTVLAEETLPETVTAVEETDLQIEGAETLANGGTEYLFDFNITGSKTAEGWTGITVNKKKGKNEKDYFYTEEKKYGITDDGSVVEGRSESVGANEEFSIPKDAYTDFALLGGKEFKADIENGTYTVQIIVGSTSSNTTKVTIEDEYTGSMNPGKEKYNVLTINDVTVEDGQMNFQFSGDGRVNGIIIGSIGVPQNVKAQTDLEQMQVKLSWDAVEGAGFYNIYRNDGEITTKIGTAEANEYTDSDVVLMGTYEYTVKAVSDTGMESAASEAVTVEIKDDSGAPAVPQGVKVSTAPESTTITWDAVDGAVEYEVYWSDRNRTDLSGTEGYALAGKTKETSFTYEKSTHMQRWFKIVAVGRGGKSEASESAEAAIANQINAQAEYLNRGLVAVNTDSGVFVSFRIPGDEYAKQAAYRIYRDGEMIHEIGAGENSNYLDPEGTPESEYTVQAIVDGKVYKECSPVTPWSEQYLEVKLQQPEPYHDDKLTAEYEYTPNDTNVADADGDGEYELFVKWDGQSYDNSKEGYTAPVYLDCYKMDGTLLWRIDLGINIRAGAHYTQFQVFDFDGDGKAELLCKTADGTLDGKGNPIDGTEEVVDYRSVKGETSSTGLSYKRNGYILDGPEYLTLFDGETGEALDTVEYDPPRGDVKSWGDDYGNRVDRFLSGVAYLDGVHPSAIFARGYYTRAVVCAYDVVDNKIVQRWKIDSNNEEAKDLYGQGAHSLTTADIDNDGCQEVIYGSATIDHDGSLLYTLGQKGDKNGGHGDAERVSDFNLKNPGKEIFMVHENNPWDAGVEMHDGATGEYVFALPTKADTGRGVAADIDPNHEGAESWAIGANSWDTRDGRLVTQDGELISEKIPAANHMIWWDGDLGREILNHNFVDTKDEAGNTVQYPVGVYISKWNWETNTEDMLLESEEVYSNNTTKGNPCFQADVFGDWREEAAWRTADNQAIRIYTTTDISDYRLYTLMHDTQYRTQTACQTTGYNQPPATSFYIGYDEELMNVPVPTLNIINNQQGEEVPDVPEPEHKHQLTEVKEKAPSCTEDGNITYYTCECGKWFADAEGTKEITDKSSVVVKATGHTDSNKDGKCDTCGNKLESVTPKPEKPDESNKPDTQNQNETIQTGDSANIILWAALVIAAGGGISSTVFIRRSSGRRNRK